MAVFALKQGISENKVRKWQEQLSKGQIEGRFRNKGSWGNLLGVRDIRNLLQLSQKSSLNYAIIDNTTCADIILFYFRSSEIIILRVLVHNFIF